MPGVTIRNVSRSYGGFWAVRNVDLDIAEGEFLTLLGPSGCGKTTTLRMVAGFLFPSSGHIKIGDRDVTGLPPNWRDTGMVFQTYALFPHLTVAQNVAFGLKMRGVRGSDASARVHDALKLVHLADFADRLPRQLSGGQQQRVALARAVVIRPQVLLMDEPLGALDLKLRQELQIQIRDVQREVGITTIYVTHDQGEALSLSDRIAVMSDGKIQQLDAPERLYSRPSSSFVANFIGRTNLFPAEIVGPAPEGYLAKLVGSAADPIVVRPDNASALEIGKRYLVGIRPESSSLDGGLPNSIPGRVLDVRYFGSTRTLVLESDQSRTIEIDLHASARTPARDETVRVTWRPEDAFVLPHE